MTTVAAPVWHQRVLRAVPDPALIRIEAYARAVYIGATPLELTRREYDLVLFLAEHPRRVFTRPQLLQQVWGHLHTAGRTVDVHVARVRSKLGDGVVKTIRGIGYRLADDVRVRIDRS